MAKSELWRVISVAVKEDDLDGVPVVAWPFGSFYEKLGQLLLKFSLGLPFKSSCFSEVDFHSWLKSSYFGRKP